MPVRTNDMSALSADSPLVSAPPLSSLPAAHVQPDRGVKFVTNEELEQQYSRWMRAMTDHLHLVQMAKIPAPIGIWQFYDPEDQGSAYDGMITALVTLLEKSPIWQARQHGASRIKHRVQGLTLREILVVYPAILEAYLYPPSEEEVTMLRGAGFPTRDLLNIHTVRHQTAMKALKEIAERDLLLEDYEVKLWPTYEAATDAMALATALSWRMYTRSKLPDNTEEWERDEKNRQQLEKTTHYSFTMVNGQVVKGDGKLSLQELRDGVHNDATSLEVSQEQLEEAAKRVAAKLKSGEVWAEPVDDEQYRQAAQMTYEEHLQERERLRDQSSGWTQRPNQPSGFSVVKVSSEGVHSKFTEDCLPPDPYPQSHLHLSSVSFPVIDPGLIRIVNPGA